MFVNLRNDWFDPDATLRRANKNPHEMPDAWKDKLPPSAKILDEDKKPEAKK